MAGSLSGTKVAILVANGFEQSDLMEPKKALQHAGAQALIISPVGNQVRGWNHKEWGDSFPVDVALNDAQPGDYSALLLPGGVMNPDYLRWNARAVAFVKSFVDANKPIAAICHGPWTLIEAGAVKNRKITSWLSLRTDLTNAGAHWVDQEVVIDGRLFTSRKPEDIPAFNQKMIELFAHKEEPRRATA